MVVVCGLGATMSSTAVTAIFIPVALRIAQSTGTQPSRLMMPLSVAALISGMTTLVATAPNLVVNSELERNGVPGFRFFSFTPFGVPVLILGIAYMLFARRWLAARHRRKPESFHRPSLADWIEEYQLASRAHRVRVTDNSPLVGRTLGEERLRDMSGANLVAIERDSTVIQPVAKTVFRAGDILLADLAADSADPEAFTRKYALEPLPLTGAYFTDRLQEIGMAEVILPATSEYVGTTTSQIRDRYGVTVVGLRRGVVVSERGCGTRS
jgi:di/tricarboxylate transporter